MNELQIGLPTDRKWGHAQAFSSSSFPSSFSLHAKRTSLSQMDEVNHHTIVNFLLIFKRLISDYLEQSEHSERSRW